MSKVVCVQCDSVINCQSLLQPKIEAFDSIRDTLNNHLEKLSRVDNWYDFFQNSLNSVLSVHVAMFGVIVTIAIAVFGFKAWDGRKNIKELEKSQENIRNENKKISEDMEQCKNEISAQKYKIFTTSCYTQFLLCLKFSHKDDILKYLKSIADIIENPIFDSDKNISFYITQKKNIEEIKARFIQSPKDNVLDKEIEVAFAELDEFEKANLSSDEILNSNIRY